MSENIQHIDLGIIEDEERIARMKVKTVSANEFKDD